eukprot:1098953-Rhodomonas_salina.1
MGGGPRAPATRPGPGSLPRPPSSDPPPSESRTDSTELSVLPVTARGGSPSHHDLTLHRDLHVRPRSSCTALLPSRRVNLSAAMTLYRSPGPHLPLLIFHPPPATPFPHLPLAVPRRAATAAARSQASRAGFSTLSAGINTGARSTCSSHAAQEYHDAAPHRPCHGHLSGSHSRCTTSCPPTLSSPRPAGSAS